jgi:hypothetical protein
VKALRRALKALVDGDAGVQRLCGRTDCLFEWQSLNPDALPVIVYELSAAPQTGQSGDHRAADVRFACLSDREHGGKETCEDLAERLEALLTTTALYAQSVDAAPMLFDRQEMNLAPELGRGISRIVVQVTIIVKWS